MGEQKQGITTKIRLKCVDIANRNPHKLNEEGKRYLAHDIIEELPIEKISDFIKKCGYTK
jgi:hypothetical protein